MNYLFPQETVDMVVNRVNRARHVFPGREGVTAALDIMAHFKEDYSYGFQGNMHTGNYAPYLHEMAVTACDQFNCTTIIPSLYIMCSEYGLNPQIVQYSNLRDIPLKKKKSKGDKDKEEHLMKSHFAIILSIKGKEYMIDPEYYLFGKIKEKSDNHYIIEKSAFNKRKRREFSQATLWTQEEFKEMMDHCRTQEGALDMLVVGQNIGRRYHFAGYTGCEVMVHYFDETNEIRTRLYVPQAGIQNKGVYTHIYFNEDGSVKEQTLDLLVAESMHFDDFVGETVIARITLPFLKAIKVLLGDKVKVDNTARIGTYFTDPKNEGLLAAIYTKMLAKIIENTPTSEALKRMVHARTLYEYEAPEREFVFDEETRLAGLIRDYRELWKSRTNIWNQPFYFEALLHYSHLVDTNCRKITAIWKGINEKGEEIKKTESKINPHLHLRKRHKAKHDRVMDMVCYAQQTLKGASVDDMKRMVSERSLNLSVGYLALICDFIPVVSAAERLITLKPFMEDISAKVRARRAAMK